MSEKRPSLPAYVRLPDGLRFAGAAKFTSDSRLAFLPKDALSPIPPEGLPVHLILAGPGDAEEDATTVSASIDRADAREMILAPDAALPEQIGAALAPNGFHRAPLPQHGNVLDLVFEEGLDNIERNLRRFTVSLGDHLFDLSTSGRHGGSERHEHYDALNNLKRRSDGFQHQFISSVRASLEKLEKDDRGQSYADLETASARNLDLVDLDEMDEKLAIEKTISAQVERHRVALECMTIRTARVAEIEPRDARTPFHPAFIVQAFVDPFRDLSPSTVVLIDALGYFRDGYLPILDALYPRLNKLFVDAGVEPDLEDTIRDQGSLLNPVEKRIVRSPSRDAAGESLDAQEEEDGHESGTLPEEYEPQPAGQSESSRADDILAQLRGGAARPAAASPPGETPPEAGSEALRRAFAPEERPQPMRDKHDAMYDAVVRALNTSRGQLPQRAPIVQQAAAPLLDDAAAAAEISEALAEAKAAMRQSIAPIDAPIDAPLDMEASNAEPAPAPAVLSENRLNDLLEGLQSAPAPSGGTLADLPPLEDLVREASGSDETVIDHDGANRLGFIDNVFQTLHRNFEVSADMAPSLAKLRVPLARLSLKEPRFFAQPDHPAHQVLDKLSMLAGTEKSANRAMQAKVSGIVDRIAQDYDGDSEVFADAQGELDRLMAQQGRVLERNIERVVKGLEGQERLTRAQRRVEDLLEQHIDPEKTPRALVELLDGGWRSALVQLALREGEDSVAWREEAALLEQLLGDLKLSEDGELPDDELREMQLRLRALNKRLNVSNPGSVSHEDALQELTRVLAGQAALTTAVYTSPVARGVLPDASKIDQLPRLRRWLKRVRALEVGARLRYVDKEGQRQRMRLVWVSDDRDRYAFVNERGQKVAELSAIQLARQLSRGAQPPTRVDDMSVLHQSMYETLEQAQKTLSFERNRDSITQLINGDSLVSQLRRTLRHAQAHDSEHAFLALNIDNFSLVNEVFDETSGDEVLAEFARLLGQLNDRRALSARMQADEFGVLFTYRSLADARRAADKIRGDIAASSLTVNGESVSFTVSVGVAPIVRSTPSPETVLEQARSALEIAKDQGRDQVVAYDIDQEEVHQYQRDRAKSRQQLEEAMDTDRLVLRAQPLVQSAVDGSAEASHHYEILLALRDDDGELQSPSDFIRSAERFGFVTLVDRWVVRETFTWLSQLVDQQKQVPQLSINLSGTSITDNDFLDYILEQISEYGVGTSRLCFEITETGAIDNLPKAADFVRTLKNIGCEFSLDDFGTGLASHKYLKELPVDYVKIDGTFISDVHINSTDYAMAKSINDLAHFLGQRTIAECVETLDIVPALREIGIDYLQGWGVGMPRELHIVQEELPDLET
ncbi:MAG: DUF1631 family protein [Pseudomonadota bacterium]